MSRKTGTELRREVLADVAGFVCRDRQHAYGDAEDNFQAISDCWNIYLKERLTVPLTALDVGWMMVALKFARAKHRPDHLDNALDAAGYAVCVGGLVKRNANSTDSCSPSNKDSHIPTESNSPGNEGSD